MSSTVVQRPRLGKRGRSSSMRIFSISLAFSSLVCLTIAYAYLLNPPPSMLADNFNLRSEPSKSRRCAFGTLPRTALLPYQFRSTVNLMCRIDNLDDRSDIGLEVEKYDSQQVKSFLKEWGEARGKEVAQFGNTFQSGELLCQMLPKILQLIFVGGEVSIGMDLYDYLHNVKEDSEPDISKWSSRRVSEYLEHFARSNLVKLKSGRRPLLTGSNFFALDPLSLSKCDLFEDVISDRVVLKLYYQIHPTKGRESFDEMDSDFADLNSKEVSLLLASYAEKHSLRMQPMAFLLADGKELLDVIQVKNFAKRYFGCEQSKCVELVDKLRTKQQYSDYEMQELAKSFSGQYKDPWNSVDHFVSYVKTCCVEYRTRPIYFAPYIALVQCSGSGKSRMLLESSKKLRTLYVCFRSGATGYPPRTGRAIFQLFNGKGLDDAENEESYKWALVERLRHAEISARKNLPKPGSKPEAVMFESEQLRESIWNLQDADIEEELPDSEEPVLLILDEARALLDESQENAPFGVSKFRLFRRALRAYWEKFKNARLFAVLVDTSSKIKNFSPSMKADPSARQVRDEGGAFLLHPYVLRGSFDAIFHDLKLPEGTRDLTPLLKNSHYLQSGRPLVAIPFSDANQQRDFLLRKLRGGYSGRTPEPGRNLGQLSIVLTRLATAISCLSPISAELVAEHMVHLLASDFLREQMFVSHLAEPRLALAAAYAWNTAGELERNLLPALQRAMISGVVTAGDRGEIVAQVVLLQAFDAVCIAEKKNPGDFVSVVSVLEQLLPQDCMVDVREAIPLSLRDARVACGQFVQLAHHLSLDTNCRLAERHCGAFFKDRQPGIDAVVPIVAPVPAMFAVQIKNRDEQGQASTKIRERMNPSFAFKNQKIPEKDLLELDKNCVKVFLQLGADVKPACCNSEGPLQIFGLSSRCLSEPVVCALEILLDATNSIESFVLDQKAASEVDGSNLPFPDDLSIIRRILPFVIDNKPQWNDLTVVELKSIFKNNNLKLPYKKNHLKLSQDPNKHDLIEELVQKLGKEPRD